VLTLVVVHVTGNHWYLDAVAGAALVLAVHLGLAGLRRWLRLRPSRA
jgi:hypothetical protein